MIQQLHAEYLSEENKNTNSKTYLHSHVIAALLTIAKIWKQSKYTSMTEEINYGIHTHTHTEDYSAIKKNVILSFVTTPMNPEGIMLSEIIE